MLFERPQSQLAVTRQHARHGALKAVAAEENELSIKELLTQYGVIALLFHFTARSRALRPSSCSSTLASTLTACCPSGSCLERLRPRAPRARPQPWAWAARLPRRSPLVEAAGPARLALTVAATPKVSEKVREYQVVRDLLAVARVLLAAASVYCRRVISNTF